jgi:hypothetical protein
MSEDEIQPAKSVSYISSFIWNIAAENARFATEVDAADPGKTTQDAISAIILAAASAESFMNEIAHLLSTYDMYGPYRRGSNDPDWIGIGEILEQMEADKASITTKYLTASILLPGEPLRKDKEPYQSYKTLTEVRNDFAHPKPQVDERPAVTYKQPKYMSTFEQKRWVYGTRDGDARAVGYLNRLQTPQIARWACRAARDIVVNIYDRFELIPSHPINFVFTSWKNRLKDERVRE